VNETTRTSSINRTVAVVVRYAVDLEHAVEVLVAEFGFDRTLQALAAMEDDGSAVVHRAMWLTVLEGALDPAAE
jgi:hypothetical protein